MSRVARILQAAEINLKKLKFNCFKKCGAVGTVCSRAVLSATRGARSGEYDKVIWNCSGLHCSVLQTG